MPTNVRDPRTIITPDAFEISGDLLGTPLAPPFRRLWALLLDLLVIGILTAMLDDIALFVWGAAALFLIWVALQRAGSGTAPTVSTLLRVSMGCLGTVILSGVLVAWLVIRVTQDPGTLVPGVDVGTPSEPADLAELETLLEEVGEEGGPGTGAAVVQAVLAGLEGRGALGRADDAEAAEEAALRVLEATRDTELGRSQRLELLRGLTPSGVPWSDEAEEIYARALDRFEGDRLEEEDLAPAEGETEAGPATTPSRLEDLTPAGVAALDTREVLEAWLALLRREAEDPAGVDAALREALERRASTLLASDTLAALQDEVRHLEAAVERERARRQAAEENQGNAFVALVRDLWEQLGSAIGLWSIYFTILLTVWNGQTLGKKVFGLRVQRLDGEPITWFPAFERAGGYIAGLATGLLGFVQVFWDPNRQCIHDKIVGTVVVDTRAPRIPGAWKEAWAEAGDGGEGLRNLSRASPHRPDLRTRRPPRTPPSPLRPSPSPQPPEPEEPRG